MLCKMLEDSRSNNMFNFSVFFCQENAYWMNIRGSVTLLQKMSSKVKSNDLPGQGIGPFLPTQHPDIGSNFSHPYHTNTINTHRSTSLL